MNKYFFVLALLGLPSCGMHLGTNDGGSSATVSRTAQVAGQNVRLVSQPGALSAAGGSLQGTGASIYEAPLLTLNRGAGYHLAFSLPQDGASLTLVSHADANLDGGFEVEFLRQGFGPGSMQVILRAGNVSRPAVNVFGQNYFQAVDASMPISLAVDIHNEYTNGARVLVWNQVQTGANYNAGAALFDTANSQRGVRSPGRGTGKQWGLFLNQATVTVSTTGEAY